MSAYARGLERPTAFAWSPRGKLYATQENGKVVVVRPGSAPEVVARGFDVPLGLTFVGDTLYVSARGALWRVSGGTKRAIVKGLPFGRHQQDNVVYVRGRLYLGSGSTCDVCRERSRLSATVLSVRPDGTGLRVEARGLRNPYGLAVGPDERVYVTVNGQDNLGDREPAETVVVLRRGADYGWPNCWASFHRHRLSGSCTGVAKPLAYLEPHSSADGIAFWRDALFVTEWGQYLSRAHGRKVVRVGLDGRASVFATGLVHPLAIAEHDNALYVGDYSTGVVQRIRLKLVPEQRPHDEVDAPLETHVVAARAQHAFAREARLLGDAVRCDVLLVRAQLQPFEVRCGLECPPRSESRRRRRDAAAARLRADPVADLGDAVLAQIPVQPDPAGRTLDSCDEDREVRRGARAPAFTAAPRNSCASASEYGCGMMSMNSATAASLIRSTSAGARPSCQGLSVTTPSLRESG